MRLGAMLLGRPGGTRAVPLHATLGALKHARLRAHDVGLQHALPLRLARARGTRTSWAIGTRVAAPVQQSPDDPIVPPVPFMSTAGRAACASAACTGQVSANASNREWIGMPAKLSRVAGH